MTPDAWVRERFGPRATGLEPLGAGSWSRAYATTLDGREVVIRFGQHGGDFAKDALIGEIAPASLHVPRVLEHGPTGDGGGGFYAVSERRHGTFLDHLDAKDLRALLPELFTLMDTIATVDLTGADAIPGDEGWAELLLDIDSERPRLGGWRAALAGSAVGLSSFETGYALLRELAPDLPDRRELIHMDLVNRNVLVDGGHVSAVFDWGNALRGDGLYDAAWLMWWWPWQRADWQAVDIAAELVAHWSSHGGVPVDVERRLLACRLHIGLDHLAYYAWSEEWDNLARNDSRLRALIAQAG